MYFVRLPFFVKIFLITVTFGQSIAQPKEEHTISLKFIDERIIPYGQGFNQTIIGGLSGLDYNPQAKVYYLLSDDGKARFYTARIDFDLTGFKKIDWLSVRPLLQPNGKPFYFPDRNTSEIDPEAIAYNPKKELLLWTSEGERIVSSDKKVLIDPAIYVSSTEGKFVETIQLPSNLAMNSSDRGPRKNGTLEGLTFTQDYKMFYFSMEEPLMEDGPRASLSTTQSWSRIFQFDAKTKKNVAQYAYQLEPIAYPSQPDDAFKMNGVSEIHSLGDDRLLIIERSYSSGRDGCTIKLFQADLKGATDVKDVPSLKDQPPINPVKKKLILNMESLARYIDNIEGVTFGPDFANGHKSLIFISDDNFSAKQKTQFLLFEVIP